MNPDLGDMQYRPRFANFLVRCQMPGQINFHLSNVGKSDLYLPYKRTFSILNALLRALPMLSY
jgi:hypothetical protein